MTQTALHEAVARLLVPDAARLPLWLLYDPVLNDPLQLRDRSEERLWLRLPAHVDIEPASRPGFIRLSGDLDDRLFDSSVAASEAETLGDALNVGTGRAVCGWFRAETTTVQRLCAAGVQTQVGVAYRWVRWHDPRVMCQLWPILKPAQRSTILDNGACAVIVDLLGQVQRLQGTDELNPRPAPPQSGPVASAIDGWGLDHAQWHTLSDTALVISLLSGLREDGLIPDATWPLRLHALLAQARERGMAQDDDLRAYVRFVIEGQVQGLDFDEAISVARSDPGSLVFALKELLKARRESRHGAAAE